MISAYQEEGSKTQARFSCVGVKMRINQSMLLKVANDAIAKYVGTDHTLLAVYLQGSLLGDSPLIGNSADIDLFFIHTNEVSIEREIVRISDEVHLDISHHTHSIYRQPRELRVHPWLGPAVYGCKIMYDPQHFMDFVQASVRGQFSSVGKCIKPCSQTSCTRKRNMGIVHYPPAPP